MTNSVQPATGQNAKPPSSSSGNNTPATGVTSPTAQPTVSITTPCAESSTVSTPTHVASAKLARKKKHKPATCDECGLVLSSSTALKGHKKSKHSDECPHVCPFPDCERATKGYARSDQVTYHLMRYHNIKLDDVEAVTAGNAGSSAAVPSSTVGAAVPVTWGWQKKYHKSQRRVKELEVENARLRELVDLEFTNWAAYEYESSREEKDGKESGVHEGEGDEHDSADADENEDDEVMLLEHVDSIVMLEDSGQEE
ncbi:hypothetical protein GE09DRAFT_1196231 [Coniochaeta sp. 2T2.1]|nr:hypothetical protein GE09DRAFT_1196231 [Coniochaeta sp. 2T2.1]